MFGHLYLIGSLGFGSSSRRSNVGGAVPVGVEVSLHARDCPDPATSFSTIVQRVTAFQKHTGLFADGVLGSKTRLKIVELGQSRVASGVDAALPWDVVASRWRAWVASGWREEGVDM